MRRLLICLLLCPIAPVWTQNASSAQGTPEGRPEAPATGQEVVSPEVTQAEAAMAKRDWKIAQPILDGWIAAHPADAQALFDAGYVADAEGRSGDAVTLYRRAIDADPRSFDAQISLGLLLARLGQPEEARPALMAATQLDPGDSGQAAKAKAWRALARIDAGQEIGSGDTKLAGKTDPAQAAQDLLEALKLTPETPEDTLLAANLAEANGDPAAAEAAYRRLLATDPESSAAVAGLAHLLIAQKKYPDAEELLQGAVKKAPEDAALTAQLAAVYVAEDKDDALTLLQAFHARHPQETAITRMLAQVEADAGEYAESDKLYMALLAVRPQDSELLTGYGQNLIRLERPAEALKAFQSATGIDETNGEAWNGLAFAAFQTHQPAITLHALTVRSKYLPENATIYFLWATAYDTLHDKKQAAAYYHRFLDSAQGKLPDQEWQARQRLALLEKSP